MMIQERINQMPPSALYLFVRVILTVTDINLGPRGAQSKICISKSASQRLRSPLNVQPSLLSVVRLDRYRVYDIMII